MVYLMTPSSAHISMQGQKLGHLMNDDFGKDVEGKCVA